MWSRFRATEVVLRRKGGIRFLVGQRQFVLARGREYDVDNGRPLVPTRPDFLSTAFRPRPPDPMTSSPITDQLAATF
jgi:hypothetical protein